MCMTMHFLHFLILLYKWYRGIRTSSKTRCFGCFVDQVIGLRRWKTWRKKPKAFPRPWMDSFGRWRKQHFQDKQLYPRHLWKQKKHVVNIHNALYTLENSHFEANNGGGWKIIFRISIGWFLGSKVVNVQGCRWGGMFTRKAGRMVLLAMIQKKQHYLS